MEADLAFKAFMLFESSFLSDSSDSEDEFYMMMDMSRKRRRSETKRQPRNNWSEDDLLKVYPEHRLKDYIRFDLVEFRQLLTLLRVCFLV